MTSGGGPPGLGGAVSGGGAGFRLVGKACACYDRMARVMGTLTENKDNVEADSSNVGNYFTELTNTMIDMT